MSETMATEISKQNAETIARWMIEHDQLAVKMGMGLVDVAPGYCRLSMQVREDMLNAVGICHGAATFALADVAFAIASNSHGRTAVALNANINYPAASCAGDILTAEARETSLGGKTGLYQVEVKRGDGTLVGHFSGTVFRREDSVTGWMK